MKYFTKEYIELCKDKRIQELRPFLKRGDYVTNMFHATFEDILTSEVMNNPVIVWLPTGDQLDEEIIKICKDRDYNIWFIIEKIWTVQIFNKNRVDVDFESKDDNPLIAKIKLLLELLNL